MSRIAESSSSRTLDYIPLISTFSGIARITRSIYSKILHIFDPSKKAGIDKSLKDRVHVWSEGKRGAIALFPVVGNVILYYHDRDVNRELIKALQTGTKEELPALWAEVPQSSQNPTFLLKIIKDNPHILSCVSPELKKNANFMQKALDLNSGAAQYLQGWSEDEVLPLLNRIEIFGYRDETKDSRVLDAVPTLTADPGFLLKAAKLGCDVTPYLSNHRDNKDLILKIMRQFRDKKVRIGSPQAESFRPDLSVTINALRAASDNLKNDRDFIGKAIDIYDGTLNEISQENWKNDENLMFDHFVKWPTLQGFEQVGDRLKSDPQSMLKAFQKNPRVLKFVNPNLFNNENFVQGILREGQLSVTNFPEQIVRDQRFRDLVKAHAPDSFKTAFFASYPDLN